MGRRINVTYDTQRKMYIYIHIYIYIKINSVNPDDTLKEARNKE